jgi:hypothetical protein
MATYSLEHSERVRAYFRVCCRGPAGEQVFDLYHNAMSNRWVLDVAHDGPAAAASGAVHVPEAKPSLFHVPVTFAPAVNWSFDYANAGRGRAAPVHALASPTPST